MTTDNLDLGDVKDEESENIDEQKTTDFTLDFTTSSAISRVNIKFLAIYIPILWFSGLLVAIAWYGFFTHTDDAIIDTWIIEIIFIPLMFFASYFIFIFACAFFSKLFLILINLIHKPKEGIFRAELGDTDFEFWCLRTELKKLVVFLIRNCPLPWVDPWALRWFGVKINFTSHLYDAWADIDFIKFGRKVIVGQGAVVMSSMVVGKYLIIKKVIFDDYTVIGGMATVAPGTIIGRDTVLGGLSSTNFNQILEPGWIYFGIPGIKLKPNKYAETRTNTILKVNVDEQKKYQVRSEVNIDEDKKSIL